MKLWWHFYGTNVPGQWDVTIMLSGTTMPPEEARKRLLPSEIDGSELPYLASWDHRPTIAEQNLPRIFNGLAPETLADNVDDYGDDIIEEY